MPTKVLPRLHSLASVRQQPGISAIAYRELSCRRTIFSNHCAGCITAARIVRSMRASIACGDALVPTRKHLGRSRQCDRMGICFVRSTGRKRFLGPALAMRTNAKILQSAATGKHKHWRGTWSSLPERRANAGVLSPLQQLAKFHQGFSGLRFGPGECRRRFESLNPFFQFGMIRPPLDFRQTKLQPLQCAAKRNICER